MNKKLIALGLGVALSSNCIVALAAPEDKKIEEAAAKLTEEPAKEMAQEPKQLTTEERIAQLEKEIQELKEANLNNNKEIKKTNDKIKKEDERLHFFATGQVALSGAKEEGKDFEDTGSAMKLNFGARAKLNDNWTFSWLTKSSQAFRNTGDRGTQNTTNIYLSGKNLLTQGDSLTFGKYRNDELSLQQVGKSEQTGAKYTIPFGKEKDTSLTLIAGRLGTGKPSTFLNPVIANASDNANYRAAIIQHNFGPTKVSLAYRRASAMNAVSGYELYTQFPISGKLSGRYAYFKTDANDTGTTGNAGQYAALYWGEFKRGTAHSADWYIKFYHMPKYSMIDGENPKYADYNIWKIGGTWSFTKNIWLEYNYSIFNKMGGASNKLNNKQTIGATLKFSI